jgi:peptidyl-prolyl cis-trans isomerase C
LFRRVALISIKAVACRWSIFRTLGLHREPVESRHGVHVVRLDRRIEGRQLPFELVHERIADYLDDAVQHRALQQYVSILAGRAELTGVDLSAARGPLVQ